MFSTRKLDEIGGVHQQVSSLPWEWRHGWALQSERRLFWKQNLDVVWTCWRWSWCCLDIPWTCNHRLFFWTIPNEKPQKWTGFQPFPTGRDSHWDCHRDCHIKIPMLIRWSTGAKPTMPPERNRFALKFAVPPTPGVQHDLGTEAEMFGDIKAIFVAFSHRCGSLEWYGMMMMDDAMRIEINDIYVIWYGMIWDDAMIYIYNYIYIDQYTKKNPWHLLHITSPEDPPEAWRRVASHRGRAPGDWQSRGQSWDQKALAGGEK